MARGSCGLLNPGPFRRLGDVEERGGAERGRVGGRLFLDPLRKPRVVVGARAVACAVAEAVLDEEARLDGQSQMLGDRRIGEARVLHERYNGGKAALPGIAHIVGQYIAAELCQGRERRLANSVTPRPDRGTVHDWASCLPVRLEKRVSGGEKASFTVPMGPWRCLATMISARPCTAFKSSCHSRWAEACEAGGSRRAT